MKEMAEKHAAEYFQCLTDLGIAQGAAGIDALSQSVRAYMPRYHRHV